PNPSAGRSTSRRCRRTRRRWWTRPSAPDEACTKGRPGASRVVAAPVSGTSTTSCARPLPLGRDGVGTTVVPVTSPLTADAVDAAAARLVDILDPTPLHRSERLSAATGAQVWLKREDLQPVRSYKVRGAFTLIAGLTPDQRAKGVVAASAGNHAQGVAFACQRLGVDARIYLPRNTPRQKRDRVAALGGGHVEMVVVGEVYDDASRAAKADAARSGAVVVPAFDAVDTMAGQGTVAREIVDQLGRTPDVVTVPF